MGQSGHAIFDESVWMPALEKLGAVTHLTVTVYGADRRIVCGPAPPTPLFALFREFGYTPPILSECLRDCFAQAVKEPAVVITEGYGVAVVVAPLRLEGGIVGAAVGGYALTNLAQSAAIEGLARQTSIPFKRLWELARHEQPVPSRRLILHGELLQLVGDTILRENHRTRQYEETARQHQEVAAQLKTEMAAKDEFLAVLSHELRTPLTPILGWTRILHEQGENPVTRHKAVQSIERNALLQIKLVDDLLDLNRVIRGKVPLELAVHDVSGLLHSALDTTAEAAADKTIDIEYVEPADPINVKADAGRLQQVFANVLSNAVKFTPPNGHIRLRIDREGESAVVRISDSGEGIPRLFLPHVFDMFRQQEEGTRRHHAGLGIGLAVVKRLVELHQGQIDIGSRGQGQGTEVTIRLPLFDQAVGEVAEEVHKPPVAPFAGLTILVVEDTEDSLEMTHMLLELLGAHVLVARDGLEALDVMATSQPDLVLCDLRMPRMDGFEFLSELCRMQGRDHPPVVAVTGLVSEADQQRTHAAGFEGHLKKPFDGTALVSAVRVTLSHRRTA
jgi:signal transduction histidine kinase